MLVNGYIKKIMHMGREISKVKIMEKREDKYVIFTLWEQQTVPPPPPPKPCTTTYQCHQCNTCERAVQCNICETNLSCGQGCTVCLKNQSTETA